LTGWVVSGTSSFGDAEGVADEFVSFLDWSNFFTGLSPNSETN